jgi:peptidyl-prolyl cis-trans isomerase B (cyclophilin B)
MAIPVEELDDYNVLLVTTRGNIVCGFWPEAAPNHVRNFLALSAEGFYDGTIFHRVISTFMVQGGGMDAAMNKKATRSPIKNEAANGLQNKVGAIAMARTGDPHSATAQFFINVKDNGFLDKAQAQDGWGYCVFGKVTAGMDVVDKIKAVPTGAQDVPKTQVVIESIRVAP